MRRGWWKAELEFENDELEVLTDWTITWRRQITLCNILLFFLINIFIYLIFERCV